MSRSIYKYTIDVLKKVSFNPKLFRKELLKASKRLLPHEYKELMIWAKNYTFQNPHLYNAIV
jgi:glutamyl-tRNA reductase